MPKIVERPVKRFRFNAEALYARVNEHRRGLQHRVNKNAEVIDNIPMWVGEVCCNGGTRVMLEFTYGFSKESNMYAILRSRMAEAMSDDFKEHRFKEPPKWFTAKGNYERLDNSPPTGWCVMPSSDDGCHRAAVMVWWMDTKKLAEEPKSVTAMGLMPGEEWDDEE